MQDAADNLRCNHVAGSSGYVFGGNWADPRRIRNLGSLFPCFFIYSVSEDEGHDDDASDLERVCFLAICVERFFFSGFGTLFNS